MSPNGCNLSTRSEQPARGGQTAFVHRRHEPAAERVVHLQDRDGFADRHSEQAVAVSVAHDILYGSLNSNALNRTIPPLGRYPTLLDGAVEHGHDQHRDDFDGHAAKRGDRHRNHDVGAPAR